MVAIEKEQKKLRKLKELKARKYTLLRTTQISIPINVDLDKKYFLIEMLKLISCVRLYLK